MRRNRRLLPDARQLPARQFALDVLVVKEHRENMNETPSFRFGFAQATRALRITGYVIEARK
jgi:hypothetical protein